MRKKYADNTDEENEFDVDEPDEPEEIQNNHSDDDWTPDKDTSGGRRTSTRLRNIPKSRAPIIDASSTDEEEGSDESQGSKRKAGKSKGRKGTIKKPKVSSTSTPSTPIKITGPVKSVNSDSEPTSTTTNNTGNSSPTIIKINKDFTSGAFILLKNDAADTERDPPLWKIDGKALLQKYIPFQQDGKTLYKNTSVYSGWTMSNKDNYYPVSVIFKQQTRKEHIVEFHRDQLKLGGGSPEVSSSHEEPEIPVINLNPTVSLTKISTEPVEKPVIKVKSFAIVSEAESQIPAKPIVETIPVVNNINPPTPPIIKINKNFASGAFLVLRSEAANVDPPLWKIDGKALLQKYFPFSKNGKILYRSSAEFSGWSPINKKTYFPVTVIFKQQNKNEHIVELERIKWHEPDES